MEVGNGAVRPPGWNALRLLHRLAEAVRPGLVARSGGPARHMCGARHAGRQEQVRGPLLQQIGRLLRERRRPGLDEALRVLTPTPEPGLPGLRGRLRIALD